MEFEFDKEIDALLRKARPGPAAVAATAVASPHLDADTIAAFAENALPEKAKLIYLGHFADCDHCRRQLSRTVLMNTEAVAADVGTASKSIAAPVAEPAVSWISKLFKTPNLAIAMGGLILVFTGVLGYVVLNRQSADNTASIAQVTEPEQTHGGPFDSGVVSDAETNKMSNAAAAPPAASAPSSATANSANTAANVSATPALSAVDELDRRDSVEEKGKLKTGNDKQMAPVGSSDAKAPSAGLPPPAPSDRGQAAVGGRAEAKAPAKEKTRDDDVVLSERSKAEDRFAREAVPQPMKKDTGPSRSGPVNTTQGQMNSQTFDMPVIRTVGGKTFDNKSGAWYDRAYHGQATTNVRRGTADFNKLDGGLRNIANTIGGTLVVVWKDKAYRIQ